MKGGECPELWNAEHPEKVLEIARSYINAGSNLIETNTFGGNRYKLEYYGLGDQIFELNKTGAEISRKAAGDDNWVMASIGPTGKMTVMGDVTEKDFYRVFKEQSVALAAGGADAIIVETMSAIDEAVAAVKAAKENTALEVICTFTFEPTVQGEYRTMMGVSPAEASIAAVNAGADIVGANCGKGYEGMTQIIEEIKSVLPEIPVIIQANAGLPELIDGVSVFPATPEEMAGENNLWIKAGVNIIGGCCGTTDRHIHAIRKALEE
ncbi:MAG: methionine synthase [Spirochaetes bacterium]|nr:MAG: methionine synthase [Spirochaetota bacterium]